MRTWRAGLLSTAFLAGAAHAQDISLSRPGSGARAAGMGNAFIAVADDGTAASWNPAGLSQLRKPEFSLVHSTTGRTFYREGYKTRDQTAAFSTLSTASSTADLEFASAAVPFGLGGKPVTLQVGWRRLYQLTTLSQGDSERVPLSAAARAESLVRIDNTADGNIDLWSLAGAVRLTSRLSLGLSVDLYRGGWDETRNTSEDPGILGPTDFSSLVASNEVSGSNLNLGLLLVYPSFRVGAVYHGGFWADFGISQSVRSSLIDSVAATLGPGGRLHFPRSLGLGLSWRPKPLLGLALDFTYDEWTQFLVDDGPSGVEGSFSGFDGLPPGLSASRDTVTVNAGLEKLFPVKGRYVPLRFGAAYEPQGARDPLLREDYNHMILAAGTGLNTNTFKLDVAVEYRWGTYDNSQDITPVYLVGREEDYGLPPGPEAQGSARLQEWRVKVSVIYRVTETEKLRGFLKKVFGS